MNPDCYSGFFLKLIYPPLPSEKSSLIIVAKLFSVFYSVISPSFMLVYFEGCIYYILVSIPTRMVHTNSRFIDEFKNVSRLSSEYLTICFFRFFYFWHVKMFHCLTISCQTYGSVILSSAIGVPGKLKRMMFTNSYQSCTSLIFSGGPSSTNL